MTDLSEEHHQQQQIRESVQHIANTAATRAVEHTLTALGIDIKDPIKSQKEFHAVRKLAALLEDEDITDDFAFVRRLRKSTEAVRATTRTSIVAWVVPAVLGFIALMTKDWWITHFRG